MPKPLALAYIRVSTTEQAETGASLDAQRAALIAEGEERGWNVEVIEEAGKSAKTLNRPGLQAALARLDNGEAQFLLAIRLDRISRSVADFAGLLDRADKKKWGLVLLSPSIDTSTPAGRFVANVLASAAEYERGLLSVRTREALAQRRAEGVRLGRPSTLPYAVVSRIVADRNSSLTLAAIAANLNDEGVATSQGGAKWYPTTVRKVLLGQEAAKVA